MLRIFGKTAANGIKKMSLSYNNLQKSKTNHDVFGQVNREKVSDRETKENRIMSPFWKVSQSGREMKCVRTGWTHLHTY